MTPPYNQMRQIKFDIARANRLWERNAHLDRIIAGNILMWVRIKMLDMTETEKLEVQELL